jgi:glycine/D-amino acid oxidase-like deaminating enzyme
MADRQVDRGLRERRLSGAADVAIIGGGIVGCAAAACLAEAGARVELYERDEVGAAASGRNSGSIQHPFDPVLAELHLETVDHYRGLDELELADAPVGVLMLAPEQASLESAVDEIGRDCPELGATLLDPDGLRRVEPGVADGLWACRLETGYPVRPLAATRAFARRAFSAGARFHQGETAWPWVIGGRARGVLAAGVRRPAGSVLVAAGPWTPEVIDTTRSWQPIVPVWGVVADVEMDDPPRHVLEEVGVEEVAAVGEAGAAGPRASIFSLVPADGQISVGSTFLPDAPEPAAWAGRLRRGGERFVPGLARAKVVGARACPRPQSLDGRPLLGELPGLEGLWAAAGHGPWGISTGPATARMAADALLGRAEIPASLSVTRF